jgi:hypothetical protein
MLGNAAGTTARAYAHYFPSTVVDAVEIDGRLTEIGQRWFGLRPGPRLRTFTQDARPFLRSSAGGYDAILVDAYRQPYIPFYLTTREFFALARSRLARGGVVAINVGHPERSSQLEKVLTATLHAVFAHVARDAMEPTNTILLASDAPLTRDALLGAANAGGTPGDLRPLLQRAAGRLAPGLPGGEVYTDDRAPVEWLVDESLIQYAAGNR